MNINITGRNVDVTPAIDSYVKTKLERIIRHFDNVTSINVILSVDKLQQKAEITLHLKGKDIHADSVEADLYAAIDTLIDKLDRQVLKHKEKLSNHAHESQKRQIVD
ncbi:MAG: ribosome-associated translation inhibitor RaiA [Sterolibacterium sp.]|nr:ribosome-associated translation inhibitor RaiA [Sterolibacterium sp.]